MLQQNTRNLFISLFKGVEFEIECPISLSQCITAIENIPSRFWWKRKTKLTDIYPIDDNTYGFSLEVFNKRNFIVFKGRIDGKQSDSVYISGQAKIYTSFWLGAAYVFIFTVIFFKLYIFSLVGVLWLLGYLYFGASDCRDAPEMFYKMLEDAKLRPKHKR
ncbi:MAG: hypothetical protein K8L97_28665 [Anaerolineae bacterium]|nr:hypothetical protein [Anaerolineae bacterium]